MRCVDALPAIRSSRLDLPFTYDAGGLSLRVGDVIRVPLGRREILAYVIRAPYDHEEQENLRGVIGLADAPRAFDETGLDLARFVADRYLCTLGEALSAVIRGESLPHFEDRLVRVTAGPDWQRHPAIPRRLLTLIWEDFDESFSLQRLLRHPAARRIADRPALLRHVQRLVRSGDLRRERLLRKPRSHEHRVRVLYPGNAPAKGARSEALRKLVEAHPGIARADVLLAGFSSALILRAQQAGVVSEAIERPERAGEAAAAKLPEPNDEQRLALEQIACALDTRRFTQILLHGVTASGKTLVYLRAIERVVREGGRAIVLVPEISLTPQTAIQFEALFGGRVAMLHSALSEPERISAWEACARGEIDVVIGARSAVFAPVRDVRLIVVDEAHESTYKQEIVPRYHAVAVAAERMRLKGGVVILGSATPSLESYAAARTGRIDLIELHDRASGHAMPRVEIVDLTHELAGGKRAIFSTALAQALAERLAGGEKSVLFVNRRGSARFLLCRDCGSVPECPRCSISLAVHREEELLRCHYCDHHRRIPARCPKCGGERLSELGVGTERVAAEVARLFPDAKVLRMDSDTTTRVGDHARILRTFEEEGDVLVGTQMVAKGLDFPAVTLTGVVCADIGLHLPDFRAAERTFALVMQACGRSGRARPGLAIVQTYAPEHPAIRYAAAHDYASFAEEELAERRVLGYPPSARLVYLGVIGRSREQTATVAARYAEALRAYEIAEVLGPAPYPIARLNNEWRFRIALRTRHASALRRAIRERIVPLAASDHATRLAIIVDPM